MAVSNDVKLAIYNGALRRLGSRRVASLSEAREPRRVLDDIWGSAHEVVLFALEQGDWNFATKSAEVDYSPSIEPDFGYRRAFEKPDDFARLTTIASDEYLHNKLTEQSYTVESGYWFCDFDVIYVRYVSTDGEYGLDSAKWSQGFRKYLEAYLAWEGCERITNSMAKRDRLAGEMTALLRKEKSHDAQAEGTKFLPRGSWVMSRGNARNGERSRLT